MPSTGHNQRSVWTPIFSSHMSDSRPCFSEWAQLGEWAGHLSRAFSPWHGSSEWITSLQRETRNMHPADLIQALVRREQAPDSLGAAWYAAIYAHTGDSDMALACLEGAYDQRLGALVYLKVDPSCDSLRSDARFNDLLARMGLN